MASWLNRMRTKKLAPIGLDLGHSTFKAVQLQDQTLHAAAVAPMPAGFWQQPGAPLRFFRQTVKPLIEAGGFRGRTATLALPPAATHVTRLRVPLNVADDLEAVRDEIAAGLSDWLPFPMHRAIVRHIDGGVVYERHEPQRELVVFGVRRDLIEGLLDAASGVLDIQSVIPEPTALLAALACDPCAAASQSSNDARLIVDLGHRGGRAYIALDDSLCFARKVGAENLAGELQMCLGYFESAFPQGRVTGVDVVGGGAGSAGLARQLEAVLDLDVRVAEPASHLEIARDATASTRETVDAHAGRLSVALGLGLAQAMAQDTGRRVPQRGLCRA